MLFAALLIVRNRYRYFWGDIAAGQRFSFRSAEYFYRSILSIAHPKRAIFLIVLILSPCPRSLINGGNSTGAPFAFPHVATSYLHLINCLDFHHYHIGDLVLYKFPFWVNKILSMLPRQNKLFFQSSF